MKTTGACFERLTEFKLCSLGYVGCYAFGKEEVFIDQRGRNFLFLFLFKKRSLSRKPDFAISLCWQAAKRESAASEIYLFFLLLYLGLISKKQLLAHSVLMSAIMKGTHLWEEVNRKGGVVERHRERERQCKYLKGRTPHQITKHQSDRRVRIKTTFLCDLPEISVRSRTGLRSPRAAFGK